eukprot:2314294-Alexandrium_andersonii.AAC.1
MRFRGRLREASLPARAVAAAERSRGGLPARLQRPSTRVVSARPPASQPASAKPFCVGARGSGGFR